jgi:hypothetical protein
MNSILHSGERNQNNRGGLGSASTKIDNTCILGELSRFESRNNYFDKAFRDAARVCPITAIEASVESGFQHIQIVALS